MTQQVIYDFPPTLDQLLGAEWTGIAARPHHVLALIKENPSYPGYFDCHVVGHSDIGTKKPVSASGVGMMMDFILGQMGMKSSDLAWSPRAALVAQEPKRAKRSASLKCEHVYFLKAGSFLKIGKCTGHPVARVTNLQTGCPYPIEIVAYIPGGLLLERELHARFSHHHAYGEWFRLADDLEFYVNSLEPAE